MLRWGICGGGKISHDFVVGIKTRSESEHSVVAVSTRSVDSSARFAATHNIPRYYGSYDELANDEEVRRISIALFSLTRVITLHAYRCVQSSHL